MPWVALGSPAESTAGLCSRVGRRESWAGGTGQREAERGWSIFLYSSGRERLGENSPGHVIEFGKNTRNLQIHFAMTKFFQDHKSVAMGVLIDFQVPVMLLCHAKDFCHAKVGKK